MKSLTRRIKEAAELVAIAGITPAEFTACTVWKDETRIHLDPLALARVFREFCLPKSRLKIFVDERGSAHIEFAARGAIWLCCVLAKDAGGWADAIDQHAAPRLTTVLAKLPGPV